MIRFAASLAALLLVAAPVSATTETQVFAPGTCPIAPGMPLADPGRLPDGLVSELLDWIGAATGYDVEGVRANPPAVTFCKAGQAIIYEDVEVIVGEDIFGIYDSRRRQIVLRLPWDAADVRDRGVLLHELVHRVQMANREWDCRKAPELEAYSLQARYLEEHGIASGFDWALIHALSRCQADDQPATGD